MSFLLLVLSSTPRPHLFAFLERPQELFGDLWCFWPCQEEEEGTLQFSILHSSSSALPAFLLSLCFSGDGQSTVKNLILFSVSVFEMDRSSVVRKRVLLRYGAE